MGQIVKKSIMTTLYLYIGTLVSFGLSLVAVIPVRMILGEDRTFEPLIVALFALPIALGVCFFVFFRRGWEERREELKSWYIPLAVGTVVHFGLNMALHFAIYVAGAFVEQLSTFLYAAGGGKAKNFLSVPFSVMIPVWLLYWSLTVACALFGVVRGKKRRQKESEKYLEE